MKFDKDTVVFFSSVLRYNVGTYINLYSIFVSDYQKRIENYYKSLEDLPDVDAFDFMFSMIKEANKIDDLIKMNKNTFNKINHWEFVEFLDEIRCNLDTVQNTSKWVGSNRSKNNWRTISIQSNYMLNQNQTLEKVVENNFGGDSQNDWIDLSMRNNLLEQDYSVDGGNLLEISKSLSSFPLLNIKTVVDSLVGERLYGLDVSKKITFENQDLKVENYNDTLKQSVLILSGIKRGDVPEFPYFGVDANLGIGSNVGQLIFSSIVRQLTTVFASDDTITDFNVIDIYYEETNLVIEYAVDTFYNKSIKSKVTI